jgi:hypothetical protein
MTNVPMSVEIEAATRVPGFSELVRKLLNLTNSSAHGTLRIEVVAGRLQMIEKTERTLIQK